MDGAAVDAATGVATKPVGAGGIPAFEVVDAIADGELAP